MDILQTLSRELNIRPSQAEAAVELLDAGNTVPFIARYRKEMTGSLDDEQLRTLEERLRYLRAFETRRTEIETAIREQGNLTDEIRDALSKATILAELEDLYRPFRPKRKTRATVAAARGLTPLAERLLEQRAQDDPEALAHAFLSDEGPDTAAALSGARDILAERVSDDAALRARLRELCFSRGSIRAEGQKGVEDTPYATYADFSEGVRRMAGHRVLALDRGEREGFLKVSLLVDEPAALSLCESAFVRGSSPASAQVRAAADDAYSRLIFPSLEREVRASLTEKACAAAIEVFGANLKSYLMTPPLPGRVVLGLDPAYRTGCKIAVVDPTGAVLDVAVVYPTPPQNRKAEAAEKLLALIRRHGVQVISIGNGTASKESEIFVADLIREHGLSVQYMVVSEAGASVYSASKLGSEEFPQYDVSLRSAVSIARRLQDPLAELVKIEPKAIGVGQYQHDMPQRELSDKLDGVVVDCVNAVGVDLNTASAPLLSRVAGIGPALAKNIVAYREENGAFANRKALLKVPKLGKKAFEQAAGFLHLPQSEEILDRTFVHPESYGAARILLASCGYGKTEKSFSDLSERAQREGLSSLAERCGVGLPTLQDMIAELTRPGRDPREALPVPVLRSDLLDIKDLKPGQELTGTVRNCVDFGAFVDIGVHQDGLVHISRITNRFIKHPLEVLKVGDVVRVKVLEVDEKRGRISLTMKF